MSDSVKLDALFAKCENCGSNLKYSPDDKGLGCAQCGAVEPIPSTQINVKKPYENVMDDDLLNWQDIPKHLNCKNCGALIKIRNEISIDCPYCDSQNVLIQKDIKGLYPSQIIRFDFCRKTASNNFVSQVKKKFFVPNSFKKMIPERSIEGFYLPAFSFDADSKSTYSGRLYRYETRVSDGRSRNVAVYFNISGSLDFKHRDVLVESNSEVSQYHLEQLFPYNISEKVDFDSRYLFGYVVEQYNEQFKNSVYKVEQVFKNQIRQSILRKYSYDGVQRLDVNSIFSNKCFDYIMLPVYRFEYYYKKKKYLTYMNGQTGKIGGGLPKSKVKISLCVILGVLAVALPFILVYAFGG